MATTIKFKLQPTDIKALVEGKQIRRVWADEDETINVIVEIGEEA